MFCSNHNVNQSLQKYVNECFDQEPCFLGDDEKKDIHRFELEKIDQLLYRYIIAIIEVSPYADDLKSSKGDELRHMFLFIMETIFTLFNNEDRMYEELEKLKNQGEHQQFVVGMINNICQACCIMKIDLKF